jgi:transglutaminase/protease-like cytokinesis protein 3
MVQVLGKELGLDVAIRKGAVLSDDGIIGQHAWNEIKINGKWQVVDTMYLPS